MSKAQPEQQVTSEHYGTAGCVRAMTLFGTTKDMKQVFALANWIREREADGFKIQLVARYGEVKGNYQAEDECRVEVSK